MIHFKLIILKINLFFCFIVYYASAEPYIFPNNIFIKKEITYMKESDSLYFPSRWPLDFGSFDLEYIIENKQRFPNIHEKFMRAEMYGFSPWEVRLGVSSDHFLYRGFNYKPRSQLSSNAGVS